MILEAVGNTSDWLDKAGSEASAEEVEDQLAGLRSNFRRKYFQLNSPCSLEDNHQSYYVSPLWRESRNVSKTY